MSGHPARNTNSPSCGGGDALASAGGINSSGPNNNIGFYMANWPAEILSDEAWLIALASTLAHELLHIIDRDYLVDIKCEHDPAGTATIFAASVPWDAKLSTETTFSEHVRNDWCQSVTTWRQSVTQCYFLPAEEIIPFRRRTVSRIIARKGRPHSGSRTREMVRVGFRLGGEDVRSIYEPRRRGFLRRLRRTERSDTTRGEVST